jgi:hypothetical protein
MQKALARFPSLGKSDDTHSHFAMQNVLDEIEVEAVIADAGATHDRQATMTAERRRGRTG